MSRARSWRRAALVGVILALLGSAGWVIWLLGERDSRLPKLALTLPEERKRARAARLPRTMADLPKRPALLAKDNAAPLYREAVALLPAWTYRERTLWRRALDSEATLAPAEARRVREMWEAALPALRVAMAATARPHADFGWREELSDDEWKLRRETLLACDRLGLILQLSAQVAMPKAPQRVLELLGRAERLTRHLTEEGGLLVLQIRADHQQRAIRLLRRTVAEHPEREGAALAHLAQWKIAPGVLKRAWYLQCVKEQSDAARSRAKPYKSENEPFLDYNPLWRELDRLDHTLGWQLYTDASEVINLRYWQAVKKALEPLADDDLVRQWRALKALDTQEDRRGKAFAGYWYPQRYSSIAEYLLTAQLGGQLFQVERALRHKEYEVGKRSLQLEDLPVGTPITDPFSGKALLWKDSRLYSVGPDEKDDGGSATKDIVLRLDTQTAPTELRSRRSIMRHPGRTASPVE